MTFLASDVFDGARSPFLNDAGATLFTNTALLPHLKAANEELEQILITFGVPVQKTVSPVVTVTAGVTNIINSSGFPGDFLLPISLHERAVGDSDQSWVEMRERMFEPENLVPTNFFGYWAFRNNGLYVPVSLTDRQILLKYDRQLAVITGPNSPEDFYLSKRFLCARVAELAARYIGMNTVLADSLALREVEPRKDDLERIFTLQGQGVRARRPRFTVNQRRVLISG